MNWIAPTSEALGCGLWWWDTYRFGVIRDENHGEIPRFAEIRHLQKRCGEEIDVLLTIATGV